jgi:hypothetical protein
MRTWIEHPRVLWMRRTVVVSSFALMLFARSQCSAQALQSFEDLALLVNLDDDIRVEDQSGDRVTGRLVRLTRDEVWIRTDAGEKRFTRDNVREVAVRGHPLRKGALVGAGVFAVLGAVAMCSHGDEHCGIVGPLSAAPVGAGVGLAVGALVSRMKPVYRGPESRVSVPPSRAGTWAGFFDDLALRVNLDDQLVVEDQSGGRSVGRLTRLTADQVTVRTAAGEKQFARETIRRVALRSQPLRMAVLVGAGAGAALGALAAYTDPTREECADGPILAGGLGAGLGLAAGALMHRTTIVYPEGEKRTVVLPILSRDAVGVRVSRSW